MEQNNKFKELMNSFSKSPSAIIGLTLVLAFVFLAVFAPLLTNASPIEINSDFLKLPPSWQEGGNPNFIFGTDDLGRDLWTRLIFGARISLFIGLMVVFTAATTGTLLGLFAGYFGGKVDQVIMRGNDILMSLPSIMLAIVVMTILGQGLTNAIWAVSIVSIPSFARIVRSSVMAEKKKQYVQAAQIYGAGHFRLMFIEILPNTLAPLIVQSTLGISDGILNAAALSFLGLGATPPLPEWGVMLADARAYIESSPWMVTLPGLCILLVVLGFNLLGDGLRDILDPRLKK